MKGKREKEREEEKEEKSDLEKEIARFQSFHAYKTPPPDKPKTPHKKHPPAPKQKPKIIRRFEPPRRVPPQQPKPHDTHPTIVMRKVKVKCPICSTQKEIDIPADIISKSKQLATVSINPHSVCDHSFQIFLDKNFKVRGYQKPQYEVNGDGQKENTKLDRMQKVFTGIQNLKEYDKTKENNEIEKNRQEEHTSTLEMRIQNKQLTLKDIYEIFWQDIEDDNREFREFIIKDKRRKQNR